MNPTIRIGSQADPFDGITWQSFFQALNAAVSSGQFPTFSNLGAFTVALLPNATEPAYAYATNGRKVGEGAGSGSGVPVYYSSGSWRVFSTDAAVLA